MRCGFGHAPDEYQNDASILKVSPSAIMEFLKSPAHYHAKYIRGIKKQTKAMKQGNMVHMAILESEKFFDRYCREPNKSDFPNALATADDWKAICKVLGLKVSGSKDEIKQRVVEADAKFSELDWDWIVKSRTSGKEVISEADWLNIEGLKSSLEYHPKLNSLLQRPGWREQMAWVFDENNKILFRFKTDFVDSTGIIVDIKKTPKADLRSFERKIFHENLYVQSAMYFEMWKIMHEKMIPTDEQLPIPKPRAFVFAAFEMDSPHIWSAYSLDSGSLDAGEQKYVKAINRLLECRDKNNWPGYSELIEPIALPHYAWEMIQNDEDREIENGKQG